jgi:hypothetical protein
VWSSYARKARATARFTRESKATTKRCAGIIHLQKLARRPWWVVSLEEELMAASSCIACNNGSTDEKEEKRKCELVGYEALPEWLKDNEFIHGYYRCEWPMKETVLSIFSIHNETLNVWS